MRSQFQKYVFTLLLLSVVCAVTSFARIVRLWTYEELVAKSDMVAIMEPVENKPAQDTFPTSDGVPTKHFAAMDTHFKVHSVLKGRALKELTVLHFSRSTNDTIIPVNGPCFIQFLIGPLQYEKRAVKDGEPVEEVTRFNRQQPVWIAFLKRRGDGRFEPVTGQYDSVDSFRELHQASFYATP